jgi:peptide/nickel transport system permease protein
VLNYFLRRCGHAVITIVGITILVFALVRIMGDPTLQLLPEDATPEEIAEVRASLGLDQPIWIQYLRYASLALQGDFGTSIRFGEPALQLILSAVPATLELALLAFIISKLVGIYLGVLCALKRNTWLDRSIRATTITADSAPTFWIGMLLILLFSVYLQWLPSSGRGPPQSLILPVTAMVIGSLAGTIRLSRSSMLETLSSDYIKFLRSRGMPHRLIVWKHAVRNAAIPVVAISGIGLGNLVGGTIIIETVFNWPGVGRLMVEAVNSRDFALIQAGVLLVSVTTVFANLFVDMMFGIIDPRIRYE